VVVEEAGGRAWGLCGQCEAATTVASSAGGLLRVVRRGRG
jgi:hypothetical protein